MSLESKIIEDIEARCSTRSRYFSSKADLQLIALIEADCITAVRNLFSDHKDKYRWHDLRKNPEDLPPRAYSITGERTCHESDEVLAIDGAHYYFIAEYNHDERAWVDTAGYVPMWDGRIIAWREIEPFEE